MTYPPIAFAFNRQIEFNKALAAEFKRTGKTDPDAYWNDIADASQQRFLRKLQTLVTKYTPQQICDQLSNDGVAYRDVLFDCYGILWVLRCISDNEELKSLRPLYAALLLYTTEGLTEEEAIARAASASDDEVIHPERLLLSYIDSSLSKGVSLSLIL